MRNEEVFAALMKQEPKWLTRPIEELVRFQAVGSVYLATHKQLLKQIKGGQIHLAEEDRKAKLAEGQIIGEALLDVEVKIGQMLPSMEEALKTAKWRVTGETGGMPEGFRVKDKGGHSKASNARALANNPSAVAAIKAEARQNEDIPTKTAVLNRIKVEKMQDLMKKQKIQDRGQPDINIAVLDIYNKLADCYAKLSQVYKHKANISEGNKERIEEVVDQICKIIKR